MAWRRRLGQEPLARALRRFHTPFLEQAFDIVIAAHVLERSTDTVRFIAELQHVRCYWRTRIDYELLNPGADAVWTRPPADRAPAPMGARRAARPAVAAPPAAWFCRAGWCTRHERWPAGGGPG
jgi:hypothetical protein